MNWIAWLLGKRTRDSEMGMLDCVKAHPGLTAREHAAALRMDKYKVSRRLSALAEAGFVRNGKPRKCRVASRKSKTWWPNA